MAGETLGEAFDRLDLQPRPSEHELALMDPQTRDKAVQASMVTAENYEQLPAWYRLMIEQRGRATLARIEAEEAARDAS